MSYRTRTGHAEAAATAELRAPASGRHTRGRRRGRAPSGGGGARGSSGATAVLAWVPQARRGTARAWRRDGRWRETRHGGCGDCRTRVPACFTAFDKPPVLAVSLANAVPCHPALCRSSAQSRVGARVGRKFRRSLAARRRARRRDRRLRDQNRTSFRTPNEEPFGGIIWPRMAPLGIRR